MINKRPSIVTFIAWISIVLGLFGLLSTLWVTNNFALKIMMDFRLSQDGIPLQIQYGLIYFNTLSSIGCGVGMLFGNNWARLIYTGLSIFWVGSGFFFKTSQHQAIPTAIVTVIVLFCLFRPQVNRYFTRSIQA